ncbi:hypothetical protein TVAG_359720 [Trichomonas vaginalis G3]|uniref:Microbial-type PARG catalytic domain-containing protein n=1 Tax=Trichomonas vaginalis (strain ATCC PRA-98 / G3) TaxID=412133 RepID=A2DT91_TRIV3|nr:hypothetical protein TVAGG3_0968320 [Trichomonas vaginalis G3]EAY16363.1 hypothetical protein TVAG_359720 [Trichomonas vaginalis G3]KAI5488407.1 hypothetical protein TVAGG3_0968320 [Trichomonas vaginalis G3]|eukprot:XP_001328586.1 hypothetical protein [Trichomonas vaginalis G3]
MRPVTELPPVKHQAAKETIGIVKKGFYINSVGQKIDVSDQIKFSIENSKLYNLSYKFSLENAKTSENTVIDVIDSLTLEASKELVDKGIKTCALNFASARNPGGGFAGPNEAQEENLCRSSALYWSQIKHPEMYEYNRQSKSLSYSDYMIFTPDCPVWRQSDYTLLENSYNLSFITAPACNLTKGAEAETHTAMLNRIRKIVMVAIENNMKGLVLGAFGCGVFKNNPADVANYFKTVLIDEGLGKYFDYIVFPIKDGRKAGPFKRAFNIH